MSWARRDGPLALGMEVRVGDEGVLLPIDVLLPQSRPQRMSHRSHEIQQ